MSFYFNNLRITSSTDALEGPQTSTRQGAVAYECLLNITIWRLALG
jgi:hypothetical protein